MVASESGRGGTPGGRPRRVRDLARRWVAQPGRAWRWYNHQLVAHPVTTKSVTSAALFGVADALAQTRDEHAVEMPARERARRTVKMMAIGGLLVGPMNHWFYGWLADKVPSLWWRVFYEEVVKMPAVMVLIQNISNIADGMTPAESAARVKHNFPKCCAVALALWVPAGAAIQGVVPLAYRVLACNVIQVAWEAFSSLVNHASAPPALEGAAAEL